MPTRDVPFAITHPERIPKERYYAEEFFRLENEHFWPRCRAAVRRRWPDLRSMAGMEP